MKHQGVAYAFAPEAWQYKEVLQVERRQSEEGGVGLECESVACHFAVSLCEEDLEAWVGTEGVGQEALLGGFVGWRQLLVFGQAQDQAYQGGRIVWRGAADDDTVLRVLAHSSGLSFLSG